MQKKRHTLDIDFSNIVKPSRHIFVFVFQFQYSQVIRYLSTIVISFSEYTGRSKF